MFAVYIDNSISVYNAMCVVLPVCELYIVYVHNRINLNVLNGRCCIGRYRIFTWVRVRVI